MKLLKCCGIRKALASYEGIDMLGFNFIESSKRYISPKEASDIQTPASTLRVGIFGKKEGEGWGDISKGELADLILTAREAKVHAIQVHGICDFAYLKLYNFLVIQSLPVEGYEDIIRREGVDFYIVDGSTPGAGESYDYSQIKKMNLDQRFLVAGGVESQNVAGIFKTFEEEKYFCGVDIASGVDNGENIDEEKVNNINNIIYQYGESTGL